MCLLMGCCVVLRRVPLVSLDPKVLLDSVVS